MLKIKATTKIFVYCPAGVITGGAELLHQLVDLLNVNKLDAYIVYYGTDISEIPSAYNMYDIKVAEEVVDNSDNVVVFYEAVFDKIRLIKYSQVCLWWLSVDNFFLCSSRYLILNDLIKYNLMFGFKVTLYKIYELIIKRNNLFTDNISLNWLKKLNVVNAYQSEYAQNFLINQGFKQTIPLSDYINTDFYKGFTTLDRKDIILYNPKKGLAFTKKIISRANQFNWVAVQNMNRTELVKMFNISKLYIDFGYHPGKDRLPREAVLNGCCVITGVKGSARFFEDVPIENCYKFKQNGKSLNSIIETIQNVMTNYDSHVSNFNFYRNQILNEKQLFENQVKSLFQIDKV